ncbi:hypothetical protein D3C85_1684280 [compost metagenome]
MFEVPLIFLEVIERKPRPTVAELQQRSDVEQQKQTADGRTMRLIVQLRDVTFNEPGQPDLIRGASRFTKGELEHFCLERSSEGCLGARASRKVAYLSHFDFLTE